MTTAQVPGQQYGAQVAQKQLQNAMPAPKDTTSKVVAKAAQQATPQPAQQPPRSDPMQIAAALRDRVGLLNRPTGRPDEPVTAGLSRGQGAGPEILGLQRRSPLGELMRMVARQSGDGYLAQLADRSNL
jgi:hypothetical protein